VRPGKRYCPAKQVQICAVCCGMKREVEIDCPTSCTYLQASRSYEAEKRLPDPQLVAKVRKYNGDFLDRYSAILDALSAAVVEERMSSPWLVDNDVIDVYRCLAATTRTLSSGIYYESLPDGPIRVSLFRRLKAVLDQLMQPDPGGARSVLKVTEALDILDFLTLAAEAHSNVRPKSRQYLDWLTRIGPGERPSGLILP
jgi:hypothetical protein